MNVFPDTVSVTKHEMVVLDVGPGFMLAVNVVDALVGLAMVTELTLPPAQLHK